MKARRASLVLIGRVERVEPDGKAETATRRLAVVQDTSILKGSLPGAGTPGAKPGVCNVLFVSPAAGKSAARRGCGSEAISGKEGLRDEDARGAAERGQARFQHD